MRDELAVIRSSMVSIQIGDRSYPAVRSPRCPICRHPARTAIEEQILLNTQYAEIIRMVSGREYLDVDGTRVDWPSITAVQLANHFNRGHCPIDATVLAQLTTEREAELGVDYSTTANRVVDQVIFSRLILSRAQERLVRGEIDPCLREGLAAAKLLASIETDRSQEEVDRLSAYVEAMQVYFEAVQSIMTAEQWQQLGVMLNTNPTLREIAQRMDNDIQEAEVVEV